MNCLDKYIDRVFPGHGPWTALAAINFAMGTGVGLLLARVVL